MTGLPDTPEAMLALMQSRSVEASPFTRWTGTCLLRWNGGAELSIDGLSAR